MYELEKIATVEVGPDNSVARRFRRNYWIARAIFTAAILLVAGLWVYAGVLSFEFGGAWSILQVPWALVVIGTLLRMAMRIPPR